MTDVGARLLGKALAAENALPSSLQKLRIDFPGRRRYPTLTEEGLRAIKKGLEKGGWLKKPGFACEGYIDLRGSERHGMAPGKLTSHCLSTWSARRPLGT